MKAAPVVDENGAGLSSQVFCEAMQQVFAQAVQRQLSHHPFAEERLACPYPFFFAHGDPVADEMRAEGRQRPGGNDSNQAIDA